jgi:DNA-binding transcriptional ArsR family regulator
MKPNPLRIRILSTLRLQPMTVREIASCLSVRESSVRNVIREIDVMCIGKVRAHSKPWILYGVAA